MPNQPAAGKRAVIFAWSLFDFANTAFSVIIVTVIYSRYFTSHVAGGRHWLWGLRSEEHTSELQSHSFISYAVFCLKKKNIYPLKSEVPSTTHRTSALALTLPH